jgi:5-methylcytosine-specific restriction enzyme subunit McrC
MKSLSVREWDYLPVGGGQALDCLTRAEADSLLGAARLAQETLWRSGGDGERILVDGRHRLRAQQVVGVLVANGVSLEILPKIDDSTSAAQTRRNLVHMLARTLDLSVADGSMANLGWQQHDLLEILISIFGNKLYAALRRGLPRRYIEHRDDLPALRGKLDYKRQFTILAGYPQKLASIYDELSSDIPLNQILKAAVILLRRIARASINRQRLNDLESAFDAVTTVNPSSLPWDRVVLDRTNTAFHELLRLAKVLLGTRFQTTSGGDVRGISLLFEMNTLFEEYIGRTLRRVLHESSTSVSLQGPPDSALEDMTRTKRHFRTRPDIVLHRDGRNEVIIDTKWKRLSGSIDDPKRGVSQADIYQMMAYAHVYQVDRLILVYPHHPGVADARGPLSSFRIKGTADTTITIASISLDDITTVETQLRTLYECVRHVGSLKKDVPCSVSMAG